MTDLVRKSAPRVKTRGTQHPYRQFVSRKKALNETNTVKSG